MRIQILFLLLFFHANKMEAQISQIGASSEYLSIQNKNVILELPNQVITLESELPSWQIGMVITKLSSKFEQVLQINFPTINLRTNNINLSRSINGVERDHMNGNQTIYQFVANYSLLRQTVFSKSKFSYGIGVSPILTSYRFQNKFTNSYPVSYDKIHLYCNAVLKYEYSIGHSFSFALYSRLNVLNPNYIFYRVSDPNLPIENRRNTSVQFSSSNFQPQIGVSLLHSFKLKRSK